MSDNQLTISYHQNSTLGLSDLEEQELGELFKSRNIEPSFIPYTYPVRVGTLQSVIPEPNNLIVTLEGILTGHPILENIARDILVFFSKHWKNIQENRNVQHFAVIINIIVEGKQQYVGIDFEDEKTLIVACYRLSEFFKSSSSEHIPDALVELEYPKDESLSAALLPPLLRTCGSLVWVALFVTAFSIVGRWLEFPGDDPATYPKVYRVMTIILPLVVGFWGASWIFIQLRKRKLQAATSAYINEYRARAFEWAKQVSPQLSFKGGTSVNVQIVNNVAQPPSTKMKPIKILFLASNPKDTDRIRLDEEIRTIDEVLQKSEYRDLFQLEKHFAVRVSDLQNHLLRYKPDIVHFSGHGTHQSQIVLEDEYGNSNAVSQRALEKLFQVLKDNMRCVVLNACYSELQARAIAEHIETVVGMSTAIGDDAAIRFAKAFYQALGYGRDLKTAFDLGCLQIDMENLGEEDTPKLLANRKNPSTIFILERMQ